MNNNPLRLIKQLIRLPRVTIHLGSTTEGKKLLQTFNAPHPRWKLVPRKSYGVALLVLNDFEHHHAYLKAQSGKNSAAYYARKSAKEGYRFSKINPNIYIDRIHEINISSGLRQGQHLTESVKNKITAYPDENAHQYYGVFLQEQLVAWCWIIRAGELLLINRLMGHDDHLKNKVMFLLLTSTIAELLENKSENNYLMYDTWFGASDGLRLFKQRIGFHPYKVDWKE
jgi:hypothetical protein